MKMTRDGAHSGMEASSLIHPSTFVYVFMLRYMVMSADTSYFRRCFAGPTRGGQEGQKKRRWPHWAYVASCGFRGASLCLPCLFFSPFF